MSFKNLATKAGRVQKRLDTADLKTGRVRTQNGYDGVYDEFHMLRRPTAHSVNYTTGYVRQRPRSIQLKCSAPQPFVAGLLM
jgi:hypothetical protein